MRHRSRSQFCVAVALLLMSCGMSILRSQAQQQEQTQILRNADIQKLVTGGVATDTIILVITNSKTAFDVSPSALVLLKKSKVSDTIIDAMVRSASNATQPATADVTRTMRDENLNSDFATAGLRALMAIGKETGASSLYNAPYEKEKTKSLMRFMHAEDTSPNLLRHTEEMIEAADADARTGPERSVVSLLRGLFTLKLAINRNWRAMAIIGSPSAADFGMQMEPNKDMLRRHSECSSALDGVLRQRHYSNTPDQCSDLSDPGMPRHIDSVPNRW